MMLISGLDSATVYIAFPQTLTLQSIYKIQICASEKLQKINWGEGHCKKRRITDLLHV